MTFSERTEYPVPICACCKWDGIECCLVAHTPHEKMHNTEACLAAFVPTKPAPGSTDCEKKLENQRKWWRLKVETESKRDEERHQSEMKELREELSHRTGYWIYQARNNLRSWRAVRNLIGEQRSTKGDGDAYERRIHARVGRWIMQARINLRRQRSAEERARRMEQYAAKALAQGGPSVPESVLQQQIRQLQAKTDALEAQNEQLLSDLTEKKT